MRAHQSAEMSAALARTRTAFFGVGLMSGLVNMLTLTGSFFMLEVYDRVIPSRSIPTLIGLIVLALVLYTFQGLLETLRARILVRTAAVLVESLDMRVFDLVVRTPLGSAAIGDGLLPLRDLDQIRAFLAGGGPAALFDLPWLPAYLGICFLFHPLIGLAAMGGVAFLTLVTFATDWATRTSSLTATAHALRRNELAEAGRNNAEVMAALGMHRRISVRWQSAYGDYLRAQQRTTDVTGALGTLSKLFRIALQSGVLALGAFLVINGRATGGIIIASSILVSRALAPTELAIANWKSFVQARQAWTRLSDLLARMPPPARHHALPAPCASLAVEGISLALPGSGHIVVRDVAFSLKAGQGLGVIGPSASGKSSLARALVGVWPALGGKIRLDGAALEQWPREDLGGHLGYLPQEVELFAGTVGENIARFEPDAPPEMVIAAARGAGVHEMILGLPEGYDTRLGRSGSGLSAGQRQRIGLARALYRDPFLVVLDEPNANLDMDGENALTQAILGIRARGGICVVIAHRPSALAAVDLVLVMSEGRTQMFGPKEEVFKRILRPARLVPRDSTPAQSAFRMQERA